MVLICIRMLGIPFERFEFAFECFESLLNGSNLHSNASNPFPMVRISIRKFRIAFECFDPFRIVRICIQMVRIPFELFEFAFDCFESLSND